MSLASYEASLGNADAARLHMQVALDMGYPTAEVVRDPFMRGLVEDERFAELRQTETE